MRSDQREALRRLYTLRCGYCGVSEVERRNSKSAQRMYNQRHGEIRWPRAPVVRRCNTPEPRCNVRRHKFLVLKSLQPRKRHVSLTPISDSKVSGGMEAASDADPEF